MKKELITISRSVENKYRNEASRKINAFNQARKLVEQHVPVTDLDRFAESFTSYLYDELTKKNKLQGVKYSQAMMLYDIDDTFIRKYEVEFKKLSVPLTKDYQSLGKVDCGVYAQTKDEVERLNQYKDIEKSVESLIKKGVPIHYGNLSRAFYPITAIDGQKLTPNINYIKGRRTH